MRPLYIDGTEATRVKLDAPALRVSIAERADELFPLQRISRIVVTGSVCWETDALLACADHGITIAFLNGCGEVRGRWLGKSGERQLFIQRLADLVTRPDGLELYESWYDAMERMIVRSVARKLMKNQWQIVTSYQLRSFFNTQQRSLTQQPADGVYTLMRSLLSAQLVQSFQDVGIGAKSELFQDQWLDLQNDFAGLLFWDLEVPLLDWLENFNSCPRHQEIVAFYDNRSERIQHLYQGLVNKLHCWLVELH
jgi:hypothetical protein